MSGAEVNPGGFEGRRRQHAVSTPTTDDVVQTSLLASLGDIHRITKGGVKFNVLKPTEVKQFYQEAVGHGLNCKNGNLTAMEAAFRVAIMYNINVAAIDRPRIKASVNNHLKAARALRPMIEALSEREHITASAKADAPNTLGEQSMRGEKRRRARSLRTSTGTIEVGSSSLPSNKLRRLFKGASSHLEYQELIKETATSAASLYLSSSASGESSTSMAKVVKQMQDSLTTAGVEVCDTTCYTHVKKAIANIGIAVSPQISGGAALPSFIEKRIANIVRKLRERKLPVFQPEVLKWAEEAIKDT